MTKTAPDVHVIAWNWTDFEGRPIVEVDEDMTYAEYESRIAGRYAAESVGLLRAISFSDLDRALRRSGM